MIDRLRAQGGRRSLGMVLALLIEALILLMLVFSLGTWKPPGKKEGDITVVTLASDEPAEKEAEPKSEKKAQPEKRPEAKQPEKQPPVPQPPAQPRVVPVVPPIMPTKFDLPRAAEAPPTPAPPAPPARPKQAYGPPNTGGPASRDSERVGTMPNGEPLYAAEWYREPGDDVLGPYLSTARGPGWGLMACRTAPDYRVEDCVGLDEYPNGSQINRAIIAAAWEFRVRPPRLGGKYLVGSWVRIRIDYGIKREGYAP